MLVLSRSVGERLMIADVVVTLLRMTRDYAEVSLRKETGGASRVATLPRQESVEACYDCKLLYIESRGARARLGIEYPDDIVVQRCN